ncbi:uncharacterized protein LOC126909591 [Daktulosphaira vitifoliae]|uniref:uncharacterized protein LOC126909591 n=1 Tax=Daktulosphaira vitifoliae TaxID=58002 RepID=UPI0021AAFE11|nr:uncharacterized protein LOC126909591 [Daktulosphaira vitifoliae]
MSLIMFIIVIKICCSYSNNLNKIFFYDIQDILNNPGWTELMKILPNSHDKNMLFQAFNDSNDYYKEYNAGYVLNNLYGTLLIEVYIILHIISLDCLEDKTGSIEFVLTEFRKLEKMIKMFEPLIQCMTKALNYFKPKSPVYVLLKENPKYYKKISEFLLDDNLEKLKKNSSSYLFAILDKLEEVNKYIFDIQMRSDLITTSDYKPFVDEYINQFKNLSDNYEKYYPNPYHQDMKKTVEEGVQKFCKDFGFD